MNNTIPIQQEGGRRVLVVDDDQGVLAMTRAILDATGFKAIPATSGEQAIQIYQQSINEGSAIELVLLDLTLPGGMNGLETLASLREIDEHVQVIATSGYFDESAAQGARRRGFVGILPKPYTAERLMKLVQWGMSQAA